MESRKSTVTRQQEIPAVANMSRQVPAMLYVPDQEWEPVLSPEDGFARGTLFPALDKPFLGGHRHA